MLSRRKFDLRAILVVPGQTACGIGLATFAIAGGLDSCQAPQGYNSDAQIKWQSDQPISREDFKKIYEVGGGVDEYGYYHQPIPTHKVFGSEADGNGTFVAPLEGDSQTEVLLDVYQGHVIRQDFRLRQAPGVYFGRGQQP